MESTQVLIVGGGLVGLSAALFLRRQGVGCIVVERHGGTSIHPRAWGLYPRTLELFRPLELTGDLLREGAGFAAHDLNGKVESLAGREIAVSRIPAPQDVSDLSPAGRILSLSQDRIEPLLVRRAVELGADIRFGHTMTGFEQDDTGVRATVTAADGTRRVIQARHLVAADGAASPVRTALGIARQGREAFRHQISIVFEADLSEPLRGRRFAICQVKNDRVEAVLGHDDSLRRGTLIVTMDPAGGDRPEDFTERRCAGLVRDAIGVPELPVTIRSVLPWEMAALVAERFRDGNAFLVGDAAHVMPPVGGYGANTGIQDAHNLAWKLAAALSGTAGPGLLDSYHDDRHPVAVRTARQAGLRLAVRGGFADSRQRDAVADTLAVTFGYHYGTVAPGTPDFLDPRTLRGQVGTRAPHAPLWRDGRIGSTLDLFDRRPVLMAGPGAAVWASAAREAADGTGLPLEVFHDDDAIVPQQPWPERYDLTPGAALLVRPDGFVAWRADHPAADPVAAVSDALRTLYGHPAA